MLHPTACGAGIMFLVFIFSAHLVAGTQAFGMLRAQNMGDLSRRLLGRGDCWKSCPSHGPDVKYRP